MAHYLIHSLQADYISPFNSSYINEQLEKGFISSHLRNHTIGLFIQRYFVLEVGQYFYGDLEEDKNRCRLYAIPVFDSSAIF